MRQDDLILGIETSCDETACAVVRADGWVLSNAIASQIDLHQPYGGVVPELASRAHLRDILPVLQAALGEAGVAMGEIGALAVTRGPGLVGSLLAGFETAKALAYARSIPGWAIHHVAAHVASPFLGGPGAGGEGFRPADFDFPYLALAVSGGHTSLIAADAPGRMRVIGRARDDAAGEAYDKVAKLMGLGYPGGPILDRLAAEGDPNVYSFTRARIKGDPLDFSFSGLKTAVARLVEREGAARFAEDAQAARDLAAGFQACVVDSLLANVERGLEQEGMSRLAVVGGVACNRGLRRAAAERLGGVSLVFPPPRLCTDNAAMIAGLAALLGGKAQPLALDMNVDANWAMS